ncbi:MAG: hypothetical protein M5U01_02090 [Ardenticatenaceae bacterium]|nr:hypothetical protein [Ardenticatenaceae bacterium]
MPRADYTALRVPTRMTRFNGTRTDYSYSNQSGDQSQRLKQLKVTKGSTVLLDLNYSYDAASNLTVLHEMTPSHGEQLTFSYDDFNRLRTVSGDTDSASYTYDRLDRLTSVQEGGYTAIFGAWSAGTATTGAPAIQARLHERGVQLLPSLSSVERELRRRV